MPTGDDYNGDNNNGGNDDSDIIYDNLNFEGIVYRTYLVIREMYQREMHNWTVYNFIRIEQAITRQLRAESIA